MTSAKPITIIGGGLAGLTLGIGLRQRGVPVTIHEAGSYPRHRVCGEFISGRGQAVLERLGVRELLDEAGTVRARTLAFFSITRQTVPRPLPSPALCVSRHTLDAALAEKFRALGGDLNENRRVNVGNPLPGLVRATGRRVSAGEKGARWFGLKVHARNVAPTADLEMHVSPQGYVGLCRINGGEVNVCGLFRKSGSREGGFQNWRELLRGRPGSPLHGRLAGAVFEEKSFCAVAGISLRPQRASDHLEICVGDAITMIPPVTGNGMSMAFESAELAIGPLTAWSRDELSWDETRQRIARDCDASFARRLGWAGWLQRLVLTPCLQTPLVALTARSDWFWRVAFEHTR